MLLEFVYFQSKNSYESDTSRDDNDSVYSPRKSRTRSRSLSRSRSRSRSLSHSSHRSSEQSEKEDDMIIEKDSKMEKKEADKRKKLDEDLPPYYPALHVSIYSCTYYK